MTELKFSQVQRKVLFRHMMVRPHDAALEQGPEGIEIGGMYFAAYILAITVVYCLVRIAQRLQVGISAIFIGRDQINLIAHCFTDEFIERARVGSLDNLTNYIALATDRADNANLTGADSATPLMLALAGVLVSLFSADESLIDFNDAHQLTELGVVHRRAKPMSHIERSWIGRSDLTLNLHRANPLLRIEHRPEHLKPSAKRVLGILENRADKQREAIGVSRPALWIRALPFPRLIDVVNRLALSAARAMRFAVRPTMPKQVFTTRIVRRESRKQLFQRHHGTDYDTSASIRQLLYNTPRLY